MKNLAMKNSAIKNLAKDIKKKKIIISKFIRLWHFKWRLYKSIKIIQRFIRGSIVRTNTPELKKIRIKLSKKKKKKINYL